MTISPMPYYRFGRVSPVSQRRKENEPIVITGIGMIASVGDNRETVWRAVREGRSGVRRLAGLPGIPDGLVIGAPVDIEQPVPGRLKGITLGRLAAAEALEDAAVDFDRVDRRRFACAISGHMGDTGWCLEELDMRHLAPPNAVPWWHQWMPNTACSTIADWYALGGPRICHSTACASGLIDILGAVRAIRDDQADIALAGSGEGINSLFAAGFRRMKVLADDEVPARACRPFNRNRRGFVLGEGAAMFIVERLGHALARGAHIYAEILGGATLAEAHHVTGLDAESEALTHLIASALKKTHLEPSDIGYINAHGTGTQQNDLVEMRGIRRAMGTAVHSVSVSATKSMLGHLVNAAGSVELAVTTLALRDGFFPPTLNLTDPDPECRFDGIPLHGRRARFRHALKLSVAFGGHLVAVALRRWDGANAVACDASAARVA